MTCQRDRVVEDMLELSVDELQETQGGSEAYDLIADGFEFAEADGSVVIPATKSVRFRAGKG